MHQFDPTSEHKMSHEEAEAVLRVLAERQRERDEFRGQPSVQDVANLASASVYEVQSALAEVRARFVPVESSLPRHRNHIALPLVAVCSVFVLVALLAASFLLFTVRTPVPPAPMPPPVETSGPIAQPPSSIPVGGADTPPPPQ